MSATCYSLSVARCLRCAVCCPFVGICCLVFVMCCLLCVVNLCVPFAVCGCFFVTLVIGRLLLFVAASCVVLRVVCCVLFVSRCVMACVDFCVRLCSLCAGCC